jgi:hypothetical protein
MARSPVRKARGEPRRGVLNPVLNPTEDLATSVNAVLMLYPRPSSIVCILQLAARPGAARPRPKSERPQKMHGLRAGADRGPRGIGPGEQ